MWERITSCPYPKDPPAWWREVWEEVVSPVPEEVGPQMRATGWQQQVEQ